MERKFTDDEIVKALEICSKNNVIRHNEFTYEGVPLRFLFEDTFDLINRQKAYIEKVKPIHNSFERELECAKQEGIKEFAERLNKEAEKVEIDREGDFVETDNKIYNTVANWCKETSDDLLKEMTGENNGN